MSTAPLSPAEQRRMMAYDRARFLDENRRLSVEEVSIILQISPNKVRELRDTNVLRFTTVGGKSTISRRALDDYLESL